MKILAWNCRGLGNPRAIQALSNMLREKDPEIIFLSETRLVKRRMEGVRAKLGYANGFFVDSKNTAGGLALLWKESLKLSVQSFSTGHIDSVIDFPSEVGGWRFTGFYGHPVTHKRAHSW